MNAPVNLARLRPTSVICLDCKIQMLEKTSIKADVIQFSTRTKMVVYKCWSCGSETERQMAVPSSRRERAIDWAN
jgi:hypothetical protein